MGLSDIAATILFYLLSTHLGAVKSFVILFGLLAVSSIALVVTLAVTSAEDAVSLSSKLSLTLTILIIAMRLASFSTFALNYSLVVELTPTLFTGLVFAIVNTVCRTFTIFAPIIAELVGNSAWSCTVLAAIGIFTVPFLHMNTKRD